MASWIAWALSAITPRIRKERVLITVHLAKNDGPDRIRNLLNVVHETGKTRGAPRRKG
ncbi:hypothetical protein [Methylobacterium oryzae]|uniref:Protein of unassigned function n=1 Tax=Methylobacterium oryzae CBMB20 TaxID=693986 RepID=A0A089NT87_9HYPH|nr:hypothetical protein [Methylobacterium oryzae]AIQ89745.1 protein of unassigned function [Methylobacterium oryzae CBMB20]